MAGSLFNLFDPSILLPRYFIIDTNVIVERLLAAVSASVRRPDPGQVRKAANLFQRLQVEQKTGLVTPIVYSELLHIAISLYIKQEMALQGQKGRWTDFYKANPTFSRVFQPHLTQLIAMIQTNGLAFVPPNRFRHLDASIQFDQHLIDLCCTYGLDTHDAGILFEAERLGVDSIVSMDGDLQHATADFNIYTWI